MAEHQSGKQAAMADPALAALLSCEPGSRGSGGNAEAWAKLANSQGSTRPSRVPSAQTSRKQSSSNGPSQRAARGRSSSSGGNHGPVHSSAADSLPPDTGGRKKLANHWVW